MDIGIVTQLTDRSPSIVEVAREVEERGFESLWLGEHTHCPVDTVHRYTSGKYAAGAKTRGGYVPEFYKRMPDPYILLAAAAAATSTLRLGTSVGLPAEHNPLEMAKEIATLDLISGGRFEFGIGYGWSELEATNNGIPFTRRRDVMREKLLAMKALWAQETASFSGEYVNFTESWSWPKPVQHPNPPILLGAKLTARATRDIVEFCDGCLLVKAIEADDLVDSLARLNDAARAAGRREPMAVTMLDPEAALAGKRSLEEFTARLPDAVELDRYRALGVARLALAIPVNDLDTMRAALDRLTPVAKLAAG